MLQEQTYGDALQEIKRIKTLVENEAQNNINNERLKERSALATRAFNVAAQMDATVLQEIVGFYRQLTKHNQGVAEAVHVNEELFDSNLLSMVNVLEDHENLSYVDPQKMPWQYRK